MYVWNEFLAWLFSTPKTRPAPRPSVVLAHDGQQCAAFARFIDAWDALVGQGAIIESAEPPCWEYRFTGQDRRRGRIERLGASLWGMDRWARDPDEPLGEVFVYMPPPDAAHGPSVFASFGSASQALHNRRRDAERRGERAWAVFEPSGKPAGRMLQVRVTPPRNVETINTG
jgi:hypothetical protein